MATKISQLFTSQSVYKSSLKMPCLAIYQRNSPESQLFEFFYQNTVICSKGTAELKKIGYFSRNEYFGTYMFLTRSVAISLL